MDSSRYSFFISSRRLHTRSYGDWSSDVCSSDLALFQRAPELVGPGALLGGFDQLLGGEVGRASCRERVYISVVAVPLKKKKMAPHERSRTEQVGQNNRVKGKG